MQFGSEISLNLRDYPPRRIGFSGSMPITVEFMESMALWI